jgi:hypothetical protein
VALPNPVTDYREGIYPPYIEYPPMQAGASFTIGGLKEKIEAARAAAKGAGD